MGMLALQMLAACSQMQQSQTLKKAYGCARDATESHEATIVFRRLWLGDGTDTSDKLRDTRPLTPEEQSALAQYRSTMRQCRQMMVAGAADLPATNMPDLPYREASLERTDAIYDKLASGEISVATANRLAIESDGIYQADLSKIDPHFVGPADRQRQRNAQEMATEASAQMAAAQRQAEEARAKQRKSKQGKSKPPAPGMATANCAWSGNALNCVTVH
jgi:hypothetical protein